MTELTITPDIAKKKLKLAGVAASGEKVAVTIAGFGTASTGNLKLRVMAGDVPVGIFPLEDGDEWAVSGADLACTLNLSTEQAERHCRFGAEVCFVLEDTGTPQLYGVGGFTLRPWIKLAGIDVPVNLDNYKVKFAEICSQLDGLRTAIGEKYEKPSAGIPKTDLSQAVQTSLDKADAVTLKVPKSAFDPLLGLSLPDSSTQKDTRQMVQRILSVLQNAAVCFALAFSLPASGIDADTAWEDVPPQNTVKSVVEQFSPPADFSTNNPAFVAAVTNCPVAGASASDLAEVAEYGSYGTVGAAILALIAGLAALKRRMGTAETAIGGKADAADLRYALAEAEVAASAPALADRAVQKATLSSASTTFTLPALTTGKVTDFVLDVVNAYEVSDTPTAAAFALSGTIGTDYNIVVPDGDDFADMTALAAGETAEYYFTLTALALGNLPTWKVVKQKVSQYTPAQA